MARTDYGAILSTVIKDTSDAIREVNGTSALIAPANWGTNIRTMKSADDYENVLNQLIQEEVASAPVASFSDGANNLPLPELSLAINPTQSGSGDPAPDNVRPITGVSSVDVFRTGKNLCKPLSLTDSTPYFRVNYRLKKNAIPKARCIMNLIDKDPTISISDIVFGFIDSSYEDTGVALTTAQYKPVISWGTLQNDKTNVPTNGDDSIFLTGLYAFPRTEATWNKIIAKYDIQIELGSTASDYSAYQGNTYTLDLDGTRYGGTIDIVDGEAVMTCDVGFITYDGDSSENWNYTNNGYAIAKPSGAGTTSDENQGLCNQAVYTSVTNVPNGSYLIGATNFITRLNTGNNDVPTFMTYLSNNPLQVVYPLATPFTVNLGSISILTLLGQNNIWHDGNGETSCTYYANGQLYVEQHST